MSGLADKEVAARLGLSLDTVKTYWKRIRQKVGAQTRPEIIAILLEKGAQELLDESRAEIQRLSKEVASVRAGEEKFRSIAESLPIGVYVTDADDEGVYVNTAWLHMSGLSRDEALHRGWSAPVHPSDKRRAIENWSHAKPGTNGYADHLRYVRPDGELGWLAMKAAAIHSDGRVVGFVRTVVDVTFENEERERLIESTQSGFDMILIVRSPAGHEPSGEHLRIEYANRKAAECFNTEPSALTAMPVREVAPGPTGEEFRSLLNEALAAGTALEREMACPISSHPPRNVLFRIVPLPDGLVVAGRYRERVGS